MATDDKTVAMLRLLLSACALVAAVVGAVDRRALLSPLYLALALYFGYSALCSGAVQVRQALARHGHWIDVAWCTVFCLTGGGGASPFLSLYFFAILVASFRGGMRAGIEVTVASAALFALSGYAVHLLHTPIPPERLALRTSYLLIIGSLMARWGDGELVLKRRLALLSEISTGANPRLGEGQTIAAALERIRAFHDADTTVLVLAEASEEAFSMRRADRHVRGANFEQQLPREAATLLTTIPWDRGVVFTARRGETFDLSRPDEPWPTDTDATELCTRISALLDCRQFLTIAFRYDATTMARIYVTASRGAWFSADDAAFLVLALEHVAPALERLRVLDRLAFDTAARERERLARDLHDSVIQPYIGLQLGVSAALEQARARGDVVPVLERLLHSTEREIAMLREHTRNLSGQAAGSHGLVAGVRRIADVMTQATDISIQVQAEDTLLVDERVAGEALKLVAEGISNIRRHTTADAALIRLVRDHDELLIDIENTGSPGLGPPSFEPRSITARAAALGGVARVRQRPGGGTIVAIRIPL